MKVDLTVLPQETPSTCLPACLRIVLRYYAQDFSEANIAGACQANRRGVRFEHAVKFIQSLGLEITHFKDGGLHDLFDYLAVDQPIIVALGAEHLPYAGDRTSHAVAVCGLEEDNVIFIDPALGKEVRLDSMTFYKAWTSRGRSGLVIARKI